MRWRSVAYLTGSLLLYLAFAMLVPLLWAMWDRGPDRIPISAAVLASLGAGWFLIRLGEIPHELTQRECFAFVTLAWLASAAFGALPFYFSGYMANYTDAWFEAMSGLTTTGATVLSNVEALPRGLLFWRSMTHWLGGMGIIVFFVAVFPRLGVSAGQMVQAESPGPVTERLAPRIAKTAKILWAIYLAFTVAQTAALLAVGLSLFDALTHTFGTVATGGFSTRNASIAAFGNPAAEWVFIVFMLAAGCNFALYYPLALGRASRGFQNAELKFYLLTATAGSLLVALNIRPHLQGAGDGIRTALFQVLSMLTTTGYTTMDFDRWPVFGKSLLFLFMFLGGCGGSTAGAIKQIRILVILKFIAREMRRAAHPYSVTPLRVGQQIIPPQILHPILAFVAAYMAIFAGASLWLTSLGYDLQTSMSAVAATLGNVGPGFGIVGPSGSYGLLPQNAKVMLSALMLVGRLEIFTVFAFFLPASLFYVRRPGNVEDFPGLGFTKRRAGRC
jgi:trk system potassium uptake protein